MEGNLAGKKVLVMGLGRFGGGVGVSKWLASQGARVTVTDTARPDELAESVAKLQGLDITFKLGGHAVEDFTSADLLIINPAVDKGHSEFVQAALRAGVPYTTEMNLFLERCRAITIGITGSVGKSTTTALIHEALKAGAAAKVFLGGNIGRSLLQELPAIGERDLVVLELSSFMLEETPVISWSPDIAVVTNIFPNHLDRHGTMAAYSAAKQNILRFQKPDDYAILNNDHELVSRWQHLARARVIKFTTRVPAIKQLRLAMPGDHNRSNAAAALAVLDALEAMQVRINRAAALHAMEQFPGLAHRLQLVHTWHIAGTSRAIRFYNDSKATTPDASLTALEAFEPRTPVFIVGGYDKHIDLSPFTDALAKNAGAVLGIGQTGNAMVEAIREIPAAPLAEYVETLENAMMRARELLPTDPKLTSVVLSTASASWGQFANYEKRGQLFAQLAQERF
jgi:UDP-N-acetylmuramoylalanine--D-glutamate ligase